MRVVILIGAFVRGGCERQAYLLARDLRLRYGIDTGVWALKYDGQYRAAFESGGIPTNVLLWKQPHLGWVKRCLPVVREFRKNRVDVLLPFSTWPNVVAGLSYRFAGIGLCMWGERSSGSERVPGVERIAALQYRRFVANSSAGTLFLTNEMGISANRISVIPNGIEQPMATCKGRWRERLGLEPEQLLVVKVANLTRHKDHATMLRAWKIVQDEWTGASEPVLALAGSHGDTHAECLRVVQECGLSSTVRFLGSIDDVSQLLQDCDLTVFSSPREGMPNAVMECMAHGKAIIASDLPGVRDILGPLCAGAVVAPGDADMFAARMLDLLRDAQRRQTLGEANAVRIRNEFSVQRMTDRYLQLICENFPTWRRTGVPHPVLQQEVLHALPGDTQGQLSRQCAI